jgi:hypothetical protein
MAVATDRTLSKATHVSLSPLLPPSWGTLYELTKVEPPTLAAALTDGRIHPAMERNARAVSISRLSMSASVGLGDRPLARPGGLGRVVTLDREPRRINLHGGTMSAAFDVRVVKRFSFRVQADSDDEARALAVVVASGGAGPGVLKHCHCVGRRLDVERCEPAPAAPEPSTAS